MRPLPETPGRGVERRRRHHGPMGHHPGPGEGVPLHHGRGRGRGRASRGDVRTAALLLLAEEPMHGYQLMQAIADRSGGRWTPSPGAIYPTISQLEDEGLATVTAESGRKLVTLTDRGRTVVAEHRGEWADPFAGYEAATPDTDLRALLEQVHAAARQGARMGSAAQRAGAAAVLADARRALYLLLAEGPAETAAPTGDGEA